MYKLYIFAQYSVGTGVNRSVIGVFFITFSSGDEDSIDVRSKKRVRQKRKLVNRKARNNSKSRRLCKAASVKERKEL